MPAAGSSSEHHGASARPTGRRKRPRTLWSVDMARHAGQRQRKRDSWEAVRRSSETDDFGVIGVLVELPGKPTLLALLKPWRTFHFAVGRNVRVRPGPFQQRPPTLRAGSTVCRTYRCVRRLI
jgi:hypothetical protein